MNDIVNRTERTYVAAAEIPSYFKVIKRKKWQRETNRMLEQPGHSHLEDPKHNSDSAG